MLPVDTHPGQTLLVKRLEQTWKYHLFFTTPVVYLLSHYRETSKQRPGQSVIALYDPDEDTAPP